MSSETDPKEDRLSSWKEIAEYLEAQPRTCIRWEKSLGLPIHRLEGAPKSRVYAYKHELDMWLREKLKNGSAAGVATRESRLSRPDKRFLAAIPFLLVLAAGAFFLTRRDPVKPVKLPPASADGVPRSTGPFDMYPGDIITTEFLPEGKLRVWRRKNKAEFFQSWVMAPLRHTSMALGELDGDADLEVVAPGYCRELVDQDGQTASRIRFFLNAYKRGVNDWWKTTFYDPAECFIEAEDFEFTDIAIGDLDHGGGNEIALATASGISVYRYDRAKDALKLLASRVSFLEADKLHVRALRLADIDADSAQEILVLGNEWRNGLEAVNKGWLVILKWTNGGLQVVRKLGLDANVSAQSLRAGDVVPGGGPEAVFPVYRKTDTGRSLAIIGWNADRGIIFEVPFGRDEEDPYRPLFLDIGDIMRDKSGQEVVVARSDTNQLICCYWNGIELVPGPKYTLMAKAKLSNVFVNPAGDPGNRLGRIVACGSVKTGSAPGSIYLEIVDLGDGFIPVWLHAGGEETDIKVSYAAFGK